LAQRIGDRESAVAIADGQAVCVAWQEGAFEDPARATIGTTVIAEPQGWRLRGSKRFVMGAVGCDRLLVLASDREPVLVAVPSRAAGVQVQHKLLADGSHWSDINFDVSLPENAVRARGASVHEALIGATALGNLALAGVLYGLQSRVLSMTFDYLGTRVQFERPIGSFQALQHRATDLYTHAQITRFLLGEAADAIYDGVKQGTLEIYASRVKARATDAAKRIANEAIQMHGAIGFSDEYDLGLHVKRILVLSAWLGGADWHRRHLAALQPLEQEAMP
jgi:alkylation response protein AidB-like acyl-CoA dehydrogenase